MPVPGHAAAPTAPLPPAEHLLAVLDALDDAVIVVDRELRVRFLNSALIVGLGHVPGTSSADLLEQVGFEVVRADGSPWPVAQRPVQQAAQHGVVTRRVLMGLIRAGETRWVRVSARPLLGPDGELDGAVGSYRDVTGTERARHALVESEAHFRLLAENSTDVISRHSAEGVCTYASPALTDMLGWSHQDVLGRNPMHLTHPEDRAHVVAQHEAVRGDGASRTLRYRLRHRNGHWLWCESVVRPVLGDDGTLHETQTATRDISARVETEQRLARMALADPLTGLANRAALTQQLEDLLVQGRQLALLFLDLDRFKVVNDSLGHSAGDELLRVVASRLAGACRDGDVVARLGGDEFVVVAQGLDDDGAVALAERVQHVLGAPIGVAGHELVVSASVGIVTTGADVQELDADSLLRDADVSMYRAKAKGRARAVVFTEAFGEAASARLGLERDLRAGLAGGELVVHYQPQVELGSGRIAAVEALVRWQHPERGLLLPGAFLDVADDTGLVVELGRQVVELATRQVALWRRLPGCADLGLSVNLSAPELVGTGSAAAVAALCDQAGLPAGAVTVEVLESVLLDAEGDVEAALASYRAAGLALALDDFGTGSSSLLHLRRVPVGVVKVDRTFVAGLGSSRHDEAIVRAVQSLASDLGLSCIAEGVEHEPQRAWLVEHGVELAQGFLLARPLPAPEVTALLVAGASVEVGLGADG